MACRECGTVIADGSISSNMINVLVDAVVRHWIEGFVADTAEKGRDRKGGTSPVGGVLRRRGNVPLVGPHLAPGRFQRPGSHLQQGRSAD